MDKISIKEDLFYQLQKLTIKSQIIRVKLNLKTIL